MASQRQDGRKGTGGGASFPPGNPYDILQRDASNNIIFAPFEIANTGDYYVSSSAGINTPTSGSAIKPFQTIQYAINTLNTAGIIGANIKVLGGLYNFTGTDKLHYNGKITAESGAVLVSNLNVGEYLIDNFVAMSITGVFEFIIQGGKFLQNTLSYLNGTLEITCKSIYSNVNAPIINFSSSSSTNIYNAYINAPANHVQELFVAENMLGAWFQFIGCTISVFRVSFHNDAINGGTTFKNTNFYGTPTFGGKHYHVKIGQSWTSRPPAFIECDFDIVSLDDGYLDAAAIQVSSANTVFTLSKCSFSRKKDPVKSIYTNHDVTIGMFNVVSSSMFGGTGNIDQVLTNQYNYISQNIAGLRF